MPIRAIAEHEWTCLQFWAKINLLSSIYNFIHFVVQVIRFRGINLDDDPEMMALMLTIDIFHWNYELRIPRENKVKFQFQL